MCAAMCRARRVEPWQLSGPLRATFSGCLARCVHFEKVPAISSPEEPGGRAGNARIVAFVHHPADIVRIDNDRLRCKQCEKAFVAVRASGSESKDLES